MTELEIARDELAKKITLERSAAGDLRKMFRQQAREFRRYVSVYGRSPGSVDYLDDVQAILRPHYKKVQRAFRGQVQRQQKQATETQEQEAAIVIDAALADWVADAVENQAPIIVDTTGAQMQEAIEDARRDLIERDEPITNPSLAALAAVYLLRRLLGRVTGIATLATQASAEATKNIVATVMSGRVPEWGPRVPPPMPSTSGPTKKWKDMDDRKVRPAHSAADGQTVSIEQDFIVNGQSLRFPGDWGRGASISNIAGCRCSAIYEAGV